MSGEEVKKASKSSQKRHHEALKKLARDLTQLPETQLAQLPYPELVESVQLARKISRGSAKKRQIQYLARQLGQLDLTPIQAFLDKSIDAASVRQLHQLESWREQLIASELSVNPAKPFNEILAEILALHPEADRQQIRQLARRAARELQQSGQQDDQPGARMHYRKLFQYLRKL